MSSPPRAHSRSPSLASPPYVSSSASLSLAGSRSRSRARSHASRVSRRTQVSLAHSAYAFASLAREIGDRNALDLKSRKSRSRASDEGGCEDSELARSRASEERRRRAGDDAAQNGFSSTRDDVGIECKRGKDNDGCANAHGRGMSMKREKGDGEDDVARGKALDAGRSERFASTTGAGEDDRFDIDGDGEETEEETEEERMMINVVESPIGRRKSTERGEFDADIERLVGSPLPRALSASDGDEEKDAERLTPNEDVEFGNSTTTTTRTPWTATPDGAVAVGMKPADRTIGRMLFQASPTKSVGGLGEAPLHYEKIGSHSVETLGDECEEVCLMLEYALALRDRWLFDDSGGACPAVGRVDKNPPLPPKSAHTFEMVEGVMHVYEPSVGNQKDRVLAFKPPGTATSFFHDMHALLRVQSSGPSKTFCHKRLLLTEQKFHLHVMLNADREFQEQKSAPHRDFYNVRKVDTHVHHSACMNQKHLLRFIKNKLKREPHELVIYRDGKFLNLREVFESINMTAYELNVDTLDMHADKNTFHRFDRFNLKYNPCGQSRLREIFIKQDNMIRGRFLAELTKQVCDDLRANKYTMAEYRISIYGRKPAEWDNLAAWVLNHNVFSENIVWLIQIPRLYNIYHSNGTMENFQQMLDNIFVPLFEVTVDPSSHPKLHTFLQLVVGVDMVDDESKPERRPSKHMRAPVDWDVAHNPAYAYYAYYIYANLYTLNALRVAKGLNVLAFRPHAGEAGDIDHLCATFMLAKNIAHGLNLRKSPCLQYLYYLAQIPLDMSPLSNNSLFIDYHKNPFPTFFARGLAVTLSTDDPLQIHMTKEPLVEEYSVAAQVWKLSAADLCEIAKTSVLNSGFPRASKAHWVSDRYWLLGTRGNDIQKTNVPNLRAHFREDVLETERALVRRGVVQARSRGRELRVRG